MTDREAYIAFNLTDNIGSVGVARLVQAEGSVVAAWDKFPRKQAWNGEAVDLRAEEKRARAANVTLVTPADPEYPPQLLAASGHPLTLYVRGDVKALSRPAIAIVGTRRASPYGLDQAFRFGRDLADNDWAIVSGLALGIDAEAHRGALKADKGVAIGVIGSALNCFYPKENLPLAREIVERGGAVVSEFPFDRQPDQKTFPQRNHVVAGLSRGVLAVEAPSKSGTMITCDLAADLGRTVMAIPGRVDSRTSAGCLQLIRDGAVLVRSPGDVEFEMGELLKKERAARAASRPRKAPGPDSQDDALRDVYGSADEFKVLHELTCEGVTLDYLIRKTGLGAAKINTLTITLLMKGLVRFLPGNRIALPREA